MRKSRICYLISSSIPIRGRVDGFRILSAVECLKMFDKMIELREYIAISAAAISCGAAFRGRGDFS